MSMLTLGLGVQQPPWVIAAPWCTWPRSFAETVARRQLDNVHGARCQSSS